MGIENSLEIKKWGFFLNPFKWHLYATRISLYFFFCHLVITAVERSVRLLGFNGFYGQRFFWLVFFLWAFCWWWFGGFIWWILAPLKGTACYNRCIADRCCRRFPTHSANAFQSCSTPLLLVLRGASPPLRLPRLWIMASCIDLDKCPLLTRLTPLNLVRR